MIVTTSFRDAQAYELNWCMNALDIKGSNWDATISNYVTNRRKEIVDRFHYFFDGKMEWEDFIKYTTQKVCMEIGSGPFPLTTFLHWSGQRILIDPLIQNYINKAMELGLYHIFNNQTPHAQMAEDMITKYTNYVDGCIICRNILDHSQDWRTIVKNIGMYARKDSYLLIWSDLKHDPGVVGHFDIADSKQILLDEITDNKFSFIKETTIKSLDLNFGGIFRKN